MVRLGLGLIFRIMVRLRVTLRVKVRVGVRGWVGIRIIV